MGYSDLDELYDAYRCDPAFAGLRQEHIRLVPGIGTREPAALLVGEAPGATENLRQVPFCGPSGKLLRQLMSLAGLSEENSYITNVVKYRPPLNRTPTQQEVIDSLSYLREEYKLLGRPRLVVALGSVAKVALARDIKGSISNLAGTMIERKGTAYWFMFHPSYVLRQRNASSTMYEKARQHWVALGEWLGVQAPFQEEASS